MLYLKGFSYKAEGGVLKVVKGAIVVIQDSLKHGLYVLQRKIVSWNVVIS